MWGLITAMEGEVWTPGGQIIQFNQLHPRDSDTLSLPIAPLNTAQKQSMALSLWAVIPKSAAPVHSPLIQSPKPALSAVLRASKPSFSSHL